MERICWDEYFMILTLVTRIRSKDPSTKCGCILVDKRNRLIGAGYNGHARGVDFNKMPQERPAKYETIIHAENNALLNSTGNLDGATAYVSGPPCNHCWAQLIQSGIKRVVYGPVITSKDGAYANSKVDSLPKVVEDMLDGQNIEVVRWKPANLKLIINELDNLKGLISNNE
jgi:dCMP deaminase